MSLVYPPMLVLLDLITGGVGKALMGVIGLLAGHTWCVSSPISPSTIADKYRWFLSTYLPLHAPPRVRRPNPLRTPIRFQALFPRSSSSGSGRMASGSGKPVAAGAAGQKRAEAVDAVRHRWGGGNRLGGESL
jgi:Derlin-2/3